MNSQMIDPWKSDDKCARCGEPMDYRPGESYTASTDGRVWHYGCAPSRTARLREPPEAESCPMCCGPVDADGMTLAPVAESDAPKGVRT